jgi:uncharacterized membrane protein AbrB (regulator of aidB expression)
MGATSTTPIVLGFVLGIIPFSIWTWWMLRQERNARVAGFVATAPGHVSQLLVAEPSRRSAQVRAGTFCRVAGSVALTPSGEALVCTASAEGARPRWRREQTAA